MTDVRDDLLTTAIEAARAGGAVLDGYFRSRELEAEEKAANDLVSEADRAAERAVLEVIARRHPEHRILSEESGRVAAGDGDHGWVVDPLDGTSNFLQGVPIFAVSVACLERGRPVAGAILHPPTGDLFTARRGGGAFWNGRPASVSARADLGGGFLATGFPFRALGALDAYLAVFREVFSRARSIRRCGAAAVDLAWTAAGLFDGFFEFRLSPWDLAAGVLLIEEAGGVATDLDGGDRYLATGNLVAGAPGVHRELLERTRRHVDEARLAALDPEFPSWF